MNTPTLPKAQKRTLPAALVVDDDAVLRARLAKALAARGFAAHEAGTAAEGLAQARELRPALITLDLRLPGGDGISIVADLAALDPAPCVVLLSGYASVPVAVEAVKRGAADVLTKPADADQIVAAYARWKDGRGMGFPQAGSRCGTASFAGLRPRAIQPMCGTPFQGVREGHGLKGHEPHGLESPCHAPTLAEAEWNHIQRVLSDCGGNVTQAAEVLGLHRRSLQRKLEKRM